MLSRLISRRTLKLIAIGYMVKTVVLGSAWLMVPDLPQRAMEAVRQTWAWAGGTSNAPAPAAPLPAPR